MKPTTGNSRDYCRVALTRTVKRGLVGTDRGGLHKKRASAGRVLVKQILADHDSRVPHRNGASVHRWVTNPRRHHVSNENRGRPHRDAVRGADAGA